MFTTAAHTTARLPTDDLDVFRLSARTIPMLIGGMAVWSLCLLLML
jgi:hypothetical protein